MLHIVTFDLYAGERLAVSTVMPGNDDTSECRERSACSAVYFAAELGHSTSQVESRYF